MSRDNARLCWLEWRTWRHARSTVSSGEGEERMEGVELQRTDPLLACS